MLSAVLKYAPSIFPLAHSVLVTQRVESGARLNAPPISAMGLRMQEETIWIAIGLRLGVHGSLFSTHLHLMQGPVRQLRYSWVELL